MFERDSGLDSSTRLPPEDRTETEGGLRLKQCSCEARL